MTTPHEPTLKDLNTPRSIALLVGAFGPGLAVLTIVGGPILTIVAVVVPLAVVTAAHRIFLHIEARQHLEPARIPHLSDSATATQERTPATRQYTLSGGGDQTERTTAVATPA